MGYTLGVVAREHVTQALGWPAAVVALALLGGVLLVRRLRARPAVTAVTTTRRCCLVALSALSLTAVTACGGAERTDVSDIPLGQVSALDVRTVGAIRIEPVEGGTPVLHREVHYDGAPPPAAQVRTERGTVVVEDCRENCTSDLTLRVPAGTPVRADSPTGPVTVTGTGRAVLRSASGTIEATAVTGELDAEADAGSVTARDVSARARVVSQAGAVSGVDLAGPVEATAGAGGVTVSLRRPAGVVARSQAGDVAVTVPPGPYDVEATDIDRPDVGVASVPGSPNRIIAGSQAGQVRVAPTGAP